MPDCSECRRLWDAYTTAAHDTREVENKINLATLAGASDAVTALIPVMQQIAERARWTRKAFIRHVQNAHNLHVDAA